LSGEVCKNLALAGVASITLLDHENVTEYDLGAQFFLNEASIGKNVSEYDASCIVFLSHFMLESRSSST
jgi:ubiquitin-like 1-activating enzyme E1 A